MKRIRVERLHARRRHRAWVEPIPLDARDPDIVRAKAIERSGVRTSTTPGSRAGSGEAADRGR